jgi:hypothetical protein
MTAPPTRRMVWIDHAIYDAARIIAAKEDVTVSAIVERAVIHYLGYDPTAGRMS